MRSPRWNHNPSKTLPGSLAMLSIAIIWLLILGLPVHAAVLVAISAALFESLPVRVSDNLVVPLICGMMLKALKL